MRSRPAVFLDRDGVINELVLNPATDAWESPHNPDDVQLAAGAAEGVRALQRGGFVVVIVSNQPSAAKGKCTLANLHAVHERVLALLTDAGASPPKSYLCFHHPDGVVPELTRRCSCRKPATGLVLNARVDHDLDLPRSVLVGDRATDIECGRAAGCRTVLIHGPRPQADPVSCRPDHVAADLLAAASWILSETLTHAHPR